MYKPLEWCLEHSGVLEVFIESINTFLIYLSNVPSPPSYAKNLAPRDFTSGGRAGTRAQTEEGSHAVIGLKIPITAIVSVSKGPVAEAFQVDLSLFHFTPTPFRYYMAPDEVKISLVTFYFQIA